MTEILCLAALLVLAACLLVGSAVAMHGRTDDTQRLGNAIVKHEQRNGRWQ